MLAIRPKRCDRAIVGYLSAIETGMLPAVPDRGTWLGRRDHALLTLAVQTGLSVSELTGLHVHDLHPGPALTSAATARPHHPTDPAHRHSPADLAERTHRRPARARRLRALIDRINWD
ncbi:MAG: hypothetical protein M3Z25_10965 [Actinomycetota bacterium]|nr:hypothetical protein [Actinomycetota bacterium]